jgi:hypothetical protein
MNVGKLLTNGRGLIGWATVLCGVALAPAVAQARPFHLWAIQEIYSNADGTLQFIEMKDNFGGQGSLSFAPSPTISVTNGTSTNNLGALTDLSGSTLNHFLLFGTSGIHAAGAPVPDFIIPNGFLFTGGGTISFFGSNGGTYPSLPIDGVTAYSWITPVGPIPNSETNFAGTTGSIIPVPEPSTLFLVGAVGVGGACRWLARRRTRPAQIPG